MDTGANRSSVMSLKQYQVYCKMFGTVVSIDKSRAKSRAKSRRGLTGQGSAMGTAAIRIPFPKFGVIIYVDFQIMDTDCPTLLSLQEMKQNSLELRVLTNSVDLFGKSQPLCFVNGFIVHNWNRDDAGSFFFTEDELPKLHRSFGHPTVTALTNLLKRARPSEMTTDVRRALDEITEACKICAEHRTKPRRFRLTIGSDDFRFNHVVAIDVMYINNRPVLHIVDEATHYQAARFLRNMTSGEVWKTIHGAWIDIISDHQIFCE